MKFFTFLPLVLATLVGSAQNNEPISLDSIKQHVFLNITTKKEVIAIFGKNFKEINKAGDYYVEIYYPEQGFGFDCDMTTNVIDAIIIHPQIFKGKDAKETRFVKGLTLAEAIQLNGQYEFIRYYPTLNQITLLYPFKAFICKQKNVKINLTEEEKKSTDGILLQGKRLKTFLLQNKSIKIDYITIIDPE